MLLVRNLSVDKAGKTICRAAELRVKSGEHVAVIGPNGCGKTTLLRVACGLERNFNGECQVDAPLRERVYLHQSPYLFRGSVLFNIRYGLAARRVRRRDQVAVARRWLSALGVAHLAQHRCATLSGGERRRVALARAFALQPQLLLLDEPLADLDEQGKDILCSVIATQSRSTIVLSSPVPLPRELGIESIQLALPDG